MDRRQFCTLGGLTLAGLAGCLSGSGDSDDDANGDPKDGRDSGNATDNGNDGDTDTRWGETETVTEVEGAHHLFVENHTDETESAWIRVVSEDDDVLVDGRYELPDGRAIEFSDIAAWETTYDIEISLEEENLTTFEWTTTECGPDSEAPNGSRNAAVRYGADSADDSAPFDIVVDQCDAIIAGTIPSGPAEYFRLDE